MEIIKEIVFILKVTILIILMMFILIDDNGSRCSNPNF